MKISTAVFVGALTSLVSVQPVSALTFSLVDNLNCSETIFSQSTLAASCDGDSCQAGEEVSVIGSVTALTAFENERVTLQACVMNLYCPAGWSKDSGDICDWVTNLDGSECGTAGSYQISGSEKIPDDAPSALMSMQGLITIQITVGEIEDCTQTATASYFMFGFASLFAVGGLSLFFMRRRRRAILTLEDGPDHSFVQMKDIPTRGAMV